MKTNVLYVYFRAADCLVMVCKEVDIRICEKYLFVFQKLFMTITDYDVAMRYVYNLEYFKKSPALVPSLRCKVIFFHSYNLAIETYFF